MKTQSEIDRENSAFWNELCGTPLAKMLGISDDSPQSLKRFDDWYMDFYPYLNQHIDFPSFPGMSTLEVGLGYGTVSQRLTEAGAIYHGLDIAAGPVRMVRERLERLGVVADVQQGSILDPPFEWESFDRVVAIGCLHHTGNLTAALEIVHRLLKPGGMATFMVYNAASYRQWRAAPIATLRRQFADPTSYTERLQDDTEMRAAYDADTSGNAAPQTEFVTPRELKYMCRMFDSCDIAAENINEEWVFSRLQRHVACRWFGPWVGLDLYCQVVKKLN